MSVKSARHVVPSTTDPADESATPRSLGLKGDSDESNKGWIGISTARVSCGVASAVDSRRPSPGAAAGSRCAPSPSGGRARTGSGARPARGARSTATAGDGSRAAPDASRTASASPDGRTASACTSAPAHPSAQHVDDGV